MICGSLQARSSNRLLLDRAVAVAPSEVDLYHAEGLQNLPLFNPDLEVDGPLEVVDKWRREVAGSDALLIASPEYGHSLPGSLKNAIDWLIGTGELEGKRVAITASVAHPSRGRLGLDALRQTLGAVSAELVWDGVVVRGEGLDASVQKILDLLVV
ncbi:MAG: NADPH-dependent FMN reductase [Nannocystaceae bacterium]